MHPIKLASDEEVCSRQQLGVKTKVDVWEEGLKQLHNAHLMQNEVFKVINALKSLILTEDDRFKAACEAIEQIDVCRSMTGRAYQLLLQGRPTPEPIPEPEPLPTFTLEGI